MNSAFSEPQYSEVPAYCEMIPKSQFTPPPKNHALNPLLDKRINLRRPLPQRPMTSLDLPLRQQFDIPRHVSRHRRLECRVFRR